jgi:hypothetical protein
LPRSNTDKTGRVEHDARGNAVWSRTRASDPGQLPEVAELSLAEEAPETAATDPQPGSRKP